MIDIHFRDFIVFFGNPTRKKFGHLTTLHIYNSILYSYIVTQGVRQSYIQLEI